MAQSNHRLAYRQRHSIESCSTGRMTSATAPGMPGNPGDNGFMPVRRIRIHATEDAGRVVTVVNWHQYLKSATLTPFRFYAANNVEKPAVKNVDLKMLETEGPRFVAGLSPPRQKSNLLLIN